MSNEKLLILDDEEIRHSTLEKRWINSHRVFHAYNAADALKLVQEHGSFEFALLDHDLGIGSENGNEFVKALLLLEPGFFPEYVIVHSHNRDAGREMVLKLRDQGVRALYEPFKP